ncbi:hypothetical protein DFH09DRAFT_1157914, partial [Mycena vulgaris]
MVSRWWEDKRTKSACWSPLYVRLGVLGAPMVRYDVVLPRWPLVMAFFRTRLRCLCSYPLRRQTIPPLRSCWIPKFRPTVTGRPINRLFGQDSMSGHHMLNPISATSCIHGRRSGIMHVTTSGNHLSPHSKAIDNTLGYTNSQLPRSHRAAAPSLRP